MRSNHINEHKHGKIQGRKSKRIRLEREIHKNIYSMSRSGKKRKEIFLSDIHNKAILTKFYMVLPWEGGYYLDS